MTVTGRLYLAEVSMDTVQPLAFHLRRVREFSVFASKFERISMHGIKLGECTEFNVLGMTHFSSLAAHAIKVKCDKGLALNYVMFDYILNMGTSKYYVITFRDIFNPPTPFPTASSFGTLVGGANLMT